MVDAAILCGGQGTRLRALGLDLPKSLAPIGGRPFLEILVEDLARQDVARVVLCTGYRRELIQRHFAAGDWGAEICFSEETNPLGTAGAARRALPLLRSDPFLLLNGDSLTRFSVAALRARGEESQAAAVMVVTPADERGDAGALALEEGDWVRAFAEKRRLEGATFHSAGIYLLRRELLAALPVDEAISLELEVLPQLTSAAGARRLAALRVPGPTVDIGTPERLEQAQTLLAEAARGRR